MVAFILFSKARFQQTVGDSIKITTVNKISYTHIKCDLFELDLFLSIRLQLVQRVNTAQDAAVTVPLVSMVIAIQQQETVYAKVGGLDLCAKQVSVV